MSTRSNIIIKSVNGVEQFYHHCDGYLEGVGKELSLADNMASRVTNHTLVMEGGYHYEYPANELYTNFKNFMMFQKGYEYEGTELGLHGDIEFLYFVDIDKNGISVKYIEIDYDDRRTTEELVKDVQENGTEIDLIIQKI